MNSHILIGYTLDKKYKVILDASPYSDVKKAFCETKESSEYSKIEIWSRSNGLHRSKRLKIISENNAPATTYVEENPSENEDFQVDETPQKLKDRNS